jgi:hypothetical protein
MSLNFTLSTGGNVEPTRVSTRCKNWPVCRVCKDIDRSAPLVNYAHRQPPIFTELQASVAYLIDAVNWLGNNEPDAAERSLERSKAHFKKLLE